MDKDASVAKGWVEDGVSKLQTYIGCVERGGGIGEGSNMRTTTKAEKTGQEFRRALRDERDAKYEELCHITADNEWMTGYGEIVVAQLYKLNDTLDRISMRLREMRQGKPIRCLDRRAYGIRTCSFKTGQTCKAGCKEWRPA